MQHDYVISNDTGANVRADINNVLQAILTNNSGATQPSATQPGMFWGDISNASTYYLKIRNHTNDGWVSLYAYDVATKTISPVNIPSGSISSTTMQGAINELNTEKQATLVSGTNIKTVNSTSLLGSGNIAVQATLVSGTNIKTVNSTSLLGSGDVAVQESLVSGTNIKSINSSSILASGNLDLVAKVSSTDNAIVRFDGTSGAVQNSSVVINDSGNLLVGTTTDNGVDKLQVNGNMSINGNMLIAATKKIHKVSSTNTATTTLTLTINGDYRYLSGNIDIYYSNLFYDANQTASRRYILNFSNAYASYSRNLTEIGTGIGTALTLSNFQANQVSGNNYNFVFTLTFPAGGTPSFIIDGMFNNYYSNDAYNYTAVIS